MPQQQVEQAGTGSAEVSRRGFLGSVVPAAVGVVMFWPQIRSHALAVVAALVVSVVATMAVTALVLRAIAKDGEP